MTAMPDTGWNASTAKRGYYRLLAAQVLALISTGVATVALALLSYRIAGADAGTVLGTAFAIKMLAYVAITPIASAFVERLPRRATLVILDLIRASVALMLPFVTRVVEIYILIFIFQAASAAFTPIFQATIPELLPDRRDYTRALSLSRLAIEIENVVSPTLAAAFLVLVSFRGLFVGTVIGFLVSAWIVLRLDLPPARQTAGLGVWRQMAHSLNVFLTTPRLRALIAFNIAAAAATAMIVVNTVVFVQAGLSLSERATAIALAVYGIGSVTGALVMLPLLERTNDRFVMLAGGSFAAVGLLVGTLIAGYPALLVLWFVLGVGCALAQTPAGTLICRSSGDDDRQSLYAAQFALSHACLMLAYPLAGWLGTYAGIQATFLTLGLVGCCAVAAAAALWPHGDRLALRS